MNRILQIVAQFVLVLAVLWGSVGINVAHVCHEHCYTSKADNCAHSCSTPSCESGINHEQLINDPHPHHCGCADFPSGTLLKIDFESLLAINSIFTMLPKELNTLLEASINNIPKPFYAENSSKDSNFRGRDILILKSVLII